MRVKIVIAMLLSMLFCIGSQAVSKPAVNQKEVPITSMNTWLLVVKDGKPHYKFNDNASARRLNYYLDNIQYEHPDGVKPFMFTTAVATFKAKDGYYFDKKLTLNTATLQAENTTGFKRINSKTVKVYLTAFTGNMGHDVRITPEMIQYKEKLSKMNLTPIATAQINAPLFDCWSERVRWSESIAKRLIDKNMRAFYQYPTTEEYRTTDSLTVRDGKKSKYPQGYRILSIDILDDDLSDDIPGLVGEWCLINKNKFIPKACLKDIKYGAKFDGAPGQIIDSPFEFAGGTGTMEDPYLIKTAEQLNAVRKGPKYHYKLIADIDLSKWGNWIPIGGTDSYGFMGGGWNKADKGAHSFDGSFDGNGHVVSGMQIVIDEKTPFLTENEDMRAYGLFANLATSPVEYKIRNLGVVNFNIDVNYTSINTGLYLYAAAICGGMNNGTDIINCYSKGGKIRINVKGNEAYNPINEWGEIPSGAPYVHIRVGGICSSGGGAFFHDAPRGELEFMHIEKCFNDSDITVNVQNCTYEIYGAGIIGSMGETHIHECYNSGNITLPLDLKDLIEQMMATYAGGISAYAYIRELPRIYHYSTELTSFIQNCYNSGQIIGRRAAGIFNSSLSDIHLENCYNTGVVIGNEFDHSNGGYSIAPIVSSASAIIPFGKEFVRNCTTDGNSVTGPAWKLSSALGRKILASIPEDSHPSSKYNVNPGNVGTFTDVKTDIWYADAVKWAFDKGIISGTRFSPDKTCTRAQFITYLWKAAGSPEMSGANPFSDLNSSDSYYTAALWANSKGMIDGTAFGANTVITRSELVICLWKSLDCPKGEQANQYLDIKSHQSDFGKAVGWSHLNGIMGGTERYKFSPEKSCTRADVVNIMYRALK